MKIAVLSGKGGTGKTLVSVNMAAAAKEAVYIDCDVEAPNGHLFFNPEGVITKELSVLTPVVNESICNGCRQCVEFCRYNALAYIKNQLLVFEDICHSCGGCALFCPNEALAEKKRIIGKMQIGVSESVTMLSGILNIGEESGVPIIKKLLSYESINRPLTIIDCPPGSSCTVTESIKDADYCILTAEPTVFGVHNLNMIYELVRLFKKPHGVVLNKCQEGENPAETFCLEKGIPILAEIPFDMELASLNSNASIAVRENKKYQDMFASLLETVLKEAQPI